MLVKKPQPSTSGTVPKPKPKAVAEKAPDSGEKTEKAKIGKAPKRAQRVTMDGQNAALAATLTSCLSVLQQLLQANNGNTEKVVDLSDSD